MIGDNGRMNDVIISVAGQRAARRKESTVNTRFMEDSRSFVVSPVVRAPFCFYSACRLVALSMAASCEYIAFQTTTLYCTVQIVL